MIEPDDKKLGMYRDITRRDFLNGVAVGAAGILGESLLPPSTLSALEPSAAAQGRPGYEPPPPRPPECGAVMRVRLKQRMRFATINPPAGAQVQPISRKPTIW